MKFIKHKNTKCDICKQVFRNKDKRVANKKGFLIHINCGILKAKELTKNYMEQNPETFLIRDFFK